MQRYLELDKVDSQIVYESMKLARETNLCQRRISIEEAPDAVSLYAM